MQTILKIEMFNRQGKARFLCNHKLIFNGLMSVFIIGSPCRERRDLRLSTMSKNYKLFFYLNLYSDFF